MSATPRNLSSPFIQETTANQTGTGEPNNIENKSTDFTKVKLKIIMKQLWYKSGPFLLSKPYSFRRDFNEKSGNATILVNSAFV
jgi:hypothetical protein